MPSIRLKLRSRRPTVLVSVSEQTSSEPPSHLFYTALLDTGQEESFISLDILKTLNAKPSPQTMKLHFPLRGNDNDPDETIDFHTLEGVSLAPAKRTDLKADIVLGMDVIQDNTLIISGEQLIFNF